MIYRGQVLGGVVVFAPEVRLPEGTHVTVEVDQAASAPSIPLGTTLRNGVPVFHWPHHGNQPDMHLVNHLRDDEPRLTCSTSTS